jgi:hypothetical protein
MWAGFRHDPRDPRNAVLRASDHDREVVHQILGEAYADGRLDREELDSRTEQCAAARTLGELPALISDLVPPVAGPSAHRGLARAPLSEIQARAERAYESDRRDALMGFLGPSLICVAIWLILGWGDLGFFWPGFVIAGTAVNLVRTLVKHQDIVDEHVRRLEKKQAKELPARPSDEAEPPEDGTEPPEDGTEPPEDEAGR